MLNLVLRKDSKISALILGFAIIISMLVFGIARADEEDLSGAHTMLEAIAMCEEAGGYYFVGHTPNNPPYSYKKVGGQCYELANLGCEDEDGDLLWLIGTATVVDNYLCTPEYE